MIRISASAKTRCMIFSTVALLPLAVFPKALAADKGKSQSRPAASESSTTEPDNSKANTYQNGEKGMTAEQQSNTESDVKITQQIRQALVKDKDLSTYAHNVKIITEGGQVVLKGPVKSQAEKTKVEEKAGRIAGMEHVRSELEVVTR